MNKTIENTWEDKITGTTVRFIWSAGQNPSDFTPVTQCYGVCLNDKGEVLIQRKNSIHPWCLPGGTVEPGETVEETLKREFLEEVDTKVKNIILLGGQKVEFVKGDTKYINQKKIQQHLSAPLLL